MKQFIISEQEKSRILEMHQNATSRQYLMEDDGYTGPTLMGTMTVPFIKQKDGKEVFDRNTAISFTLTGDKNAKSIGETSLENIKSIANIKIDTVNAGIKAIGNHGATVYTGGNQDIIKYLTNMVGKTTEIGSKDILVTVNLVSGGSGLYPSYTTFIKKIRPQQ